MRQDEAERIEQQLDFEPHVGEDDGSGTWTCGECHAVNSCLDGECQFCEAADDGSVQSCGGLGGYCHAGAVGHYGPCGTLDEIERDRGQSRPLLRWAIGVYDASGRRIAQEGRHLFRDEAEHACRRRVAGGAVATVELVELAEAVAS